MNPEEYVSNVLKTESVDFEKIVQRVNNRGMFRLLHAVMGMATESGEAVDILKNTIFYGKKLDLVNLIEEMGDMMWYLGIACDQIGIDFDEVMETNISKLKARYGTKFSEDAAINRNLDQERKILEKSEKVR